VDGCCQLKGTGDCLFLPNRDKWMGVGTGQRPVSGCWHLMGTGEYLLLPDRDQWLDVGTVWGPVAGCCCQVWTSD